MNRKLLLTSAALTAVPGLALADTTTYPAPDFSAMTSYITAAIPIGVAALGVALIASLAFAIVFKIGKKLVSAA